MTYLEAGNKSYSEGRKALKAKKFNKAAQSFNHAKEMFERHEWQFGSVKSPAINISTQMLRQSIQMRDAA